MNSRISNKKTVFAMIMGVVGCLFMGASDWLMIYGNTSYAGKLAWLTTGAAQIEPWKNSLAMGLAFPAIIFYSIGLFGVAQFIKNSKHKHIYSYLTAIGLTPWLCLHLFYVMILFAFGFIYKDDQALAYTVCEAMFSQFSWLVILGEIIILLPFIYLFYLLCSGKCVFKKAMVINNPLLIYVVLKVITLLMPDCAFRLAFTNGLMSESMLIWFIVFIFTLSLIKKRSAKSEV